MCPPRVTGDNCDQCVPATYGYDPLVGCTVSSVVIIITQHKGCLVNLLVNTSCKNSECITVKHL